MKKLLGIVVLVLMWCNVGFADKLTISYFKKNLVLEELFQWSVNHEKTFRDRGSGFVDLR